MQKKMDDKEFETNCKDCPYLLAFDRQVADGQDKVAVDCRLPKCHLEPDEKLGKVKSEAKVKGKAK